MSSTNTYRQVFEDMGISAPGANTDAITDVTWPSDRPARVTVQVATSTIANLMVNRTGETEVALGLNNSVALDAGAVYIFDVPGLKKGDTVNFQVETDSVIDWLALGTVL